MFDIDKVCTTARAEADPGTFAVGGGGGQGQGWRIIGGGLQPPEAMGDRGSGGYLHKILTPP